MMYSFDSVACLYERYLVHRSIATDSRNIAPHAIFFALRGFSFDGHAFAQQALERGASCVVIDDARYQADSRYILVDNVLQYSVATFVIKVNINIGKGYAVRI